jgi:hypothetical protein
LVSVRPVHFAVLLGVLAACATSVGSAAASPQFGRPQSVAKAEFISRPVAAAGPGGALTFAFVPELHDGMVRGTWKPGSPLLDPPFRGRDIVTRLRIASSPRGVIALAWVESHFPGPLNRHRIRVAVKAPGHGFSQARTVAVVSDVSDPAIQVVVADDRSVAVAWTNTPDTLATRSQLAVRWPGHAFTKPLRLSRPGREALSAGPQLAVSRGGHVLAAWVDSELFSIPGALRVARVADGRLSPVTKVSTGSDEVGEAFRLAANSEGKVALAWTIRLRSERRIANLAIGTTRSGLGGLRYLSRGRGGRGPVPAVGPRGEVAVVWFESAPRGQRKLVAANWVGGDRFTRAQELAVGSIVLPRLVVDASGRPSVLWLERGHHSVVRAVAGPRRGDFGPVQTVLRTRHGVSRPELAASGDRTVAVVIEEGAKAGHDVLWSSVRDGALGFGATTAVVRTVITDLTFTHPGLVPYGDGGFLTVWHQISHSDLKDRLRVSALRP